MTLGLSDLVRRWRAVPGVPVRVVGRAPLTHVHAVFVVEIGEGAEARRIVVGTGPQAVTWLGEVGEDPGGGG